jgi:hypothetical protein
MKMEQIDGKWYAVDRWSTQVILFCDDDKNNLTEEECTRVLEYLCERTDYNIKIFDIIDSGIDWVVKCREGRE